MDRRSWPWKKKSSDKAAVEKAVATLASAGAALPSSGSQAEQEKPTKPKYVQLTMETYSHLNGLEEQVKTYEDQVKTLEDEIREYDEKLSSAQSEMTTKDNLVKQHAKVAEEAVSGWEKAEAEALALKNHLESVTLLKLTAEDKCAHLDGALKECMRQIRNLKEEHEQKVHEVVLTKTKQCEKIKLEFEAKIATLDQELLKAAAENAALSRSLQDRSNMLIKISEEKSQAEAEIELLKSNIESCEREISSLKYEFHLVSKELEIRNEEKNMSMRSAEVANKQHLEGVKKIAKLEAECQRLRGLVRKKLPGPAALAQMKLEVENLGRDYGETRLKKSPVKPPTPPHLSSLPELPLDNIQKFHKENEFLTDRILTMEEETKMLKEALAKRNSELQASRNLCAKTSSKLQSLESQMQLSNNDQERSQPKPNIQNSVEGSLSQYASNAPSLTSMSEEGNDDVASCSDSCATASISELSHFKNEKNNEKSTKEENSNHLGLMDDFLEMEKLACLSTNSNGPIEISNIKGDENCGKPVETSVSLAGKVPPCHEDLSMGSESDTDQLPLLKLKSAISDLFETSKETGIGKMLEEIKRVVQETCDTLNWNSGKEISFFQGKKSDMKHVISSDLSKAISQIHDFISILAKEAMAVHGDGWNQKIEEFSNMYGEVLCTEVSLFDFILDLSRVLAKASELSFNVVGYKGNEAETNNSDCIDKVALLENKIVDESSTGRFSISNDNCAHISDSTSDPEIPHEGNLIPSSESTLTSSCKWSLEEFERLKLENGNMELNLAKYSENLQNTKSQLEETEKLLAEVKSQLTSSQKMNGLAETQLKCMAESYKSLEVRAEELETEVNLLRAKVETIASELNEEKRGHHEALVRCKDLQEQLQRVEDSSMCSSAAENDIKSKQERELAAAAEKLAECQETIFLLGRQLKAMHPQTDLMGSPYSDRSQKGDAFNEEDTSSTMIHNIVQADEVGNDSPMDLYNAPYSPSDTEPNLLLKSPNNLRTPKHRPTKSTSSSSSSGPTPEKNQRGFSRFFSSKGKNNGY